MADEPLSIRCWCAPPGMAYLMSHNPCTYPNCVSGDRPPPMPIEADDSRCEHGVQSVECEQCIWEQSVLDDQATDEDYDDA
jgi:hypothetical protein